jgi:fatty acid desaturase
MFAYLGLILLCYMAFRFTESLPLRILLSLIIGNIFACIGFLTHELAHGVIIQERLPRYAMEYLFWGLLFIPATVWRRVHNQTHHAHAGTVKDPDRAFMHSEEVPMTRWYTRIFYPNHRGLRWNPLVALHLIPYIARNVLSVFYPSHTKPSFVPVVPHYSPRQRLAVVFEVFGIFIFQVGVFALVGGHLSSYLLASPLAFVMTSAVTMGYIFTNHFLHPIAETSDPVLGSTSVIVPPVFDRIHEHFSLHTEHHLFPTMNSDFYPLVARELQKNFPERYSRIGLFAAWKRLWQGEEFLTLPSTHATQVERKE